MSAPWFKFYPSDWRADPALRMCSIGARGLWMEMLCVMHEAEPRGSLLVNGNPVSDRQLAGLAGCSLKEAAGLIEELEAAGVFSREGETIICARLRDEPFPYELRPPRHVWAEIRSSIFRRDDFTCSYCGERGGRLECDHIIPVSAGGSHEPTNLTTACFGCNRAKGARSPSEWIR